jgi:cell division protein FtsL
MAIEFVFEKQINNAAVHHDVDLEQRRQYFLLVGLAGLFMVGLLVYGWQQYQWVQSGYDIVAAQKQRDELAEYRKQLLVERTFLARAERIDNIARTRLGMTLAAPGQTVMWSADGPTTLPVEPALEPPALSASKR